MTREYLTEALVLWIQDEGAKGTIPASRMDHQVVIGRFTAQMLTVLNCADQELVTSVSVLEKMMFDHGVSATKLKSLHQTICQPQRIYRSATHTATSVVVVTMQNLNNKPILVPIWLSKAGPAGKSPVHWVSSGYVKDDPNIFATWEAKGLLLWKQNP